MPDERGPTMRTFVEVLNERGGRRRTHHDALFRWEDAIQDATTGDVYDELDSDAKSDLHLKASMLKRVTSLAAKQETLSNDFCAWLSAALEGQFDHELRSGLVEVRVAEALMADSSRFRVLDVPGRNGGTKKTDFALGEGASVECKRLIGSPASGRDRVLDADAQHAAAKADLSEHALGITVLCLGKVEDLDDLESDDLDEVLVEVDGVLDDADNTDAVLIVVESWRPSGDGYEASFHVAVLLKPNRTIQDSLPEELRAWTPEVIKRRAQS